MNFGTRARKLPRLGEDDLELQCAKNDAYALSASLKLGVGVGDIKFPVNALDFDIGGVQLPIDLNKFGLGGKTLIGGIDFGEIEVVKPHAFPSACGPICNGCYEDYLQNVDEWTQQALGESADQQWDNDGRLSTVAIIFIVVGCLGLVAVGAVVAKRQGAADSFRDRFFDAWRHQRQEADSEAEFCRCAPARTLPHWRDAKGIHRHPARGR